MSSERMVCPVRLSAAAARLAEITFRWRSMRSSTSSRDTCHSGCVSVECEANLMQKCKISGKIKCASEAFIFTGLEQINWVAKWSEDGDIEVSFPLWKDLINIVICCCFPSKMSVVLFLRMSTQTFVSLQT